MENNIENAFVYLNLSPKENLIFKDWKPKLQNNFKFFVPENSVPLFTVQNGVVDFNAKRMKAVVDYLSLAKGRSSVTKYWADCCLKYILYYYPASLKTLDVSKISSEGKVLLLDWLKIAEGLYHHKYINTRQLQMQYLNSLEYKELKTILASESCSAT